MRGRKGLGVDPRARDIRLRFTWKGQRYSVPLPLAPSLTNVQYARRLAAKIRDEIELGVFSFARHFPNSPHARTVPVETFTRYAATWLLSKGKLAPATRSQYMLAINFWQRQRVRDEELGAMLVAEVKHSDLAALVGSIPWPSPRMCNNTLIPLRGIFAMAARDGVFVKSPMDGIENASRQKDPPDPFTAAEADAIIEWLYRHCPVEVGAYYEFAFYSGVRPEEQIAIRWQKIDFTARTVLIDTVRTFRGWEGPTKTYQVRYIECTKRAWAAIQRMRGITQLQAHGHVFASPRTRRPWHDERSQARPFRRALAALQIRRRRPYQTRHTFATTALARQCNPQWVARQLGHKNAKMLWEVYARWIDAADHGREVRRFDAEQFGR